MKAILPKGGMPGVGNLQQLAKQAQEAQTKMQEMSAKLETKEYTATSGGGKVKVVLTGDMKVKNIEISPEVVDPEDTEMLSDMIIAAVNEAIRQAESEKESVMDSISADMNLPAMNLPGLF